MISKIRYKKPVESSLAKTAISLGGIGFLAPQLAKGFESHLSEIIADSGKLLRTVIQNKLAVIKPAYRRNEKWLGKNFNNLFRLESMYIELSGTELMAVMKLLKEEPGMDIHSRGTYQVPVEAAERILSRLDQIERSC